MVAMMSLWQRTKTTSKSGFDKAYNLVDKLGAPVNRASNKLGSEAFWPTTLNKESEKAARILQSFCKDGFYQEEEVQPADGPKSKQKVIKKIPSEVIKNAKGLAIFTVMRTGLWVSGAGGSGVLVGKLPDGSWSPPSGIMLHTAGLGFLVGIDIYDCVMVINTEEALKAFTRIRCTIGGEMSAVAGPVGMGGVVESEVHKRRAPIFTYMKSRGFYAGVQLDGTILIERNDENERYYKEKLSAFDIVTGKVRYIPYDCRPFLQTIRAAQGDTDVDASDLPTEASPSDFEIVESSVSFGIPGKDDPDPYGFLALQKQGLLIREAGSHKRASVDEFQFNPVPTSPVFTTFNHRQSIDATMSRRSSWRTSVMSNNTNNTTSMTDRSTQTTDMSTQTDFDSPRISPVLSARKSPRMAEIEEEPFKVASTFASIAPPLPPRSANPVIVSPVNEERAVVDDTKFVKDEAEPVREEADPIKTEVKPVQEQVIRPVTPTNPISPMSPDIEYKADAENSAGELDDDDEIFDEPIVHQVQKAASPQFVARARLVTVQKRPTPALPPRNPGRERKPSVLNAGAANDETPIEALTPPETVSHSRQSSQSTFRGLSSGHRSNSEASISSVEQLSGLEKHLAAFKVNDKETTQPQDREPKTDDREKELEKDADSFHSIPPTPEPERVTPIVT